MSNSRKSDSGDLVPQCLCVCAEQGMAQGMLEGEGLQFKLTNRVHLLSCELSVTPCAARAVSTGCIKAALGFAE